MKECSAPKKPKDIGLTTFTEYFRAINDPNDRFFQADDNVINFNNNILPNELNTMFAELDTPFSADELQKGISKLNTGKSAGPDLILNELFLMVKENFHHIC